MSFSYDDDDKLVQGGAMTLGYDAITGLLTGTTLGPVEESISYSAFGEPTGQAVSISGSAVFNASFTRDKLGRITEKVETVQGAATTYHYTYDAAGRLETVTENGTLVSQYSYDANGNRLTHTTQSGSVTAAYDDQDRMLTYGNATYSYNAFGDLESKTEGSVTTNYLYDENSNLREATLAAGQTIEYLIDGKNRRVGRVVNGALEQQFLYQDQLNPVAELDGTGSIVARFVYASKINVPDYMERSGAVYRIVSDYLGSVRLVIEEATGQVVQRMDYDEFGNVLFDSNPGFQPFGYAGGLYDRDIGLIRFGARDYDPETGRWTEKDPVRFDGGVNFYVYSNSDPINIIDNTGELPVLSIATAAGLTIGGLLALIAEGHMRCMEACQSGSFDKDGLDECEITGDKSTDTQINNLNKTEECTVKCSPLAGGAGGIITSLSSSSLISNFIQLISKNE